MNTDCVRYRYERDTNAEYCSSDELESVYGFPEDCKGCPEYYNKEDARNDSKFGHLDNY